MAKIVERLMVLGLDGATWTVLDPMRRRGLMPNLDAAIGSGRLRHAASIIPPVTTAAWTSMMTGCGPARHGVFDHRYYDAAEGRMKVNHSGRIRVPTLWHLLNGAGRLDHLPQFAGSLSAACAARNRCLGNGRAAPRGRRYRPRPSLLCGVPTRLPAMV